jgi:hypothetical protein
LTPEDRAKIETIRDAYGLPTMAAAIRFTIDRCHEPLARARAERVGRGDRP